MPFIYTNNPTRNLEVIEGVIGHINYYKTKMGDERFWASMGFNIIEREENFLFRVLWGNDPLAFRQGERVRVYVDERPGKLFVKVAGIETLPERGQKPYYRSTQKFQHI